MAECADPEFGKRSKLMLLVIDNYDSFTWNLVHYIGELGAEPRVFRNDKISVDDILNNLLVVIYFYLLLPDRQILHERG